MDTNCSATSTAASVPILFAAVSLFPLFFCPAQARTTAAEAEQYVLQGQQQAALEKERQMQQVQGEIASAKEKLGEMVRQVDELSARLEYFGSICQ